MQQQLLNIQQQLSKDEIWRHADFSDILSHSLRTTTPDDNTSYTLHCNIPDLDTYKVITVNGYCQHPLQHYPNGVIIGSLNEARQKHPDLVDNILQKETANNPYASLNKDNYSDGAFIYIPDNTIVDKPIQLLSIFTGDKALLVQTRNIISIGDNSRICLIHCDDSLGIQPSFANNVTQIVASRHAHIEHYKMQNLGDTTGLLNHTYISLDECCELLSVVVTLNGGNIRNHTEIEMLGEHCDVQAHGLYLNDRNQKIDNFIFVDHKKPNCKSNELFKGILDDSAQGTFNGHVLVRNGATKTEAYQSNKNILLTDKALIYTKPFLEIYNDDVKCSHGSTIGQIDDDAMFYLQSRGISPRTARTLLLYAFCDEVLQKISLPNLYSRLSDMVKQRLHGDLTVCSECALHCTSTCGCSQSQFTIDPTKL